MVMHYLLKFTRAFHSLHPLFCEFSVYFRVQPNLGSFGLAIEIASYATMVMQNCLKLLVVFGELHSEKATIYLYVQTP